jgi:hypothetical protein
MSILLNKKYHCYSNKDKISLIDTAAHEKILCAAAMNFESKSVAQ